MIQDGSRVALEYTLKLEDGRTAASNVGQEPLVYQHGGGQILPALEQALTGLRVDDETSVVLSPDQGYGERDERAVQRVSPAVVPEELRQVGTTLALQDGSGQRVPVRVQEVADEAVVLDLNHPLAGETLRFDVRVLAVDDPSAAPGG